MSLVTNVIKRSLPDNLVNALRSYRGRRRLKAFAGLPTKEIFAKIYEDGEWAGGSRDAEGRFFSGSGSRNFAVDSYVAAVEKFLRSLGHKPDIVDLGCGDFNVGSRIRPSCQRYVACDIVDALIAHDAAKYASMDVDFRTLDITSEELPEGEVVFIRQVLQHLSNSDIARVVPKLPSRFRYLVLTEHVPPDPFPHNLDKVSGPDNRLAIHSGIVLTSLPFDMPALEATVICEVEEWGGVIRTIVYRFR